ncbi:glycosyltransferase family 2 protein [Hydrogenimonas sp.]
MEALSVVILTHDSEKYLDEVLSSASFADETLILDSGSTDRTLEIAEKHGCRIEKGEWPGFGLQKQKAVELAEHDWVYVLDSDETIPPPLREEILHVLERPLHDGYRVPRLNHFFGKPLRHGGLYPDATIRLFDRRKGSFTPDAVHEKVRIAGSVGSLENPMHHYAYESVEAFIDKQNRYSTLGAKSDRFKALVNPFWTFVRMYLLKGGFLDGWEGFVVARLYSQYTFWKYVK